MNQNFALKDCNRKVVIECDRNIVTARLYDGECKISTGIAKCSPEDVFDFNVGSKLALERAFENIPKPSNVEWVKVNRPIRVGDFVRIVETNFTFNEVGDILKVSATHSYGFAVRASDHPHPNRSCLQHGANKEWWYLNAYAEVVEPVTKNQEWVVVNRKPKVGDYIRVTRHSNSFGDFGEVLKVDEVTRDGHVRIKLEHHPKAKQYIEDHANGWWPYDNWIYTTREFEVVEPVNFVMYNGQKFRKVNREPKKGDYIRLNKPFFTFDNTTDLMKVHYVDSHCDKIVPHVRHCENPGAMKHEKDFSKSYHPHFIWNYWQFDGDVYELVND